MKFLSIISKLILIYIKKKSTVPAGNILVPTIGKYLKRELKIR